MPGAGVRGRARHAVDGVEHAGEHLADGVARLESRVRNEEPFWPAQLAAAFALVLYLTLPNKVVIGPSWLIPAVEGILLLGLVVTTPTRHRDQSPRRRAIVIGLLALVSLTTFVSLILLTHYLLQGGKAGGHPLIVAGIVLWATNVLIFGIWFWELDRGGPGMRCHHEDLPPPDFFFPQMAEPELSPGWKPGFMDYLYTSFTNATAFSPTDVLPLTRWTKMTMLLQSAVSLSTVALVIARAVNILQ